MMLNWYEIINKNSGQNLGRINAENIYQALDKAIEQHGIGVKIGQMIKIIPNPEVPGTPFQVDHVGTDSFKEGQLAREWRERSGFSRRQLAELTGYSERTITCYENGEWAVDRPVDPVSYLTYRLACGSIALGVQFDWKRVLLTPKGAVQIAIPLEDEESS